MLLKFLRRSGWVLLGLVVLLLLLWAAGALFYDLPAAPVVRKIVAVLFLLVTVSCGLFGRGRLRWCAPLAACVVTVWWLTLKPSNDRDWLADVDRTGWAEVNGDRVTLHNVRNFDYRTETEFTAHWETRTVDLSKLTGIDMAINYWGSPYIAHPIVSFQFSDAPPICFSIETRKEKGESYSAIGGLYRQYELIFIIAEERDVIRVRTNYRKGEDIYLYRLHMTPEKARGRFMEYVNSLNRLRDQPKWYNAITTNCTTSIRSQHAHHRRPWDWRILLNGKGDEMLFEQGAIGAGEMPFAEFKKRSLIDDDAKAADQSADFSSLIRANAPSFQR
ncbi:MAG: DUF4105 domain-containing protein [Verrucomicrobiota bacterium]